MSADFPWPKKGDKAFVEGEPHDAFVLTNIFPHYPFKADAFKQAGDALLDMHLEDGRTRDDLFFPVAYLYRHAIELRLKNIIGVGVGLGFIRKEDVPKRSHDLWHLWGLAKKAIVGRWKDGPEVQAAASVIKEFHDADEKGESFRYDMPPNINLPKTMPRQISPADLRRVVDGTFSFLDSCWDGLGDSLQNMMDSVR